MCCWQACIKLWESWLGQTPAAPCNRHDQDRLDRNRKTRTDAIVFWQQWLDDYHKLWDGKEEQTFLLPPAQMTLPSAQYKQTVPIPPGMSEAEVKCFALICT